MLYLTSLAGKAQTASPAEQLAEKFAKRMQQYLGLDDSQYHRIYVVNMDIANRKMEARRNNPGQPAYVNALFQQIENQRDSLYRTALRSNEKFRLYRSQKLSIIKAD